MGARSKGKTSAAALKAVDIDSQLLSEDSDEDSSKGDLHSSTGDGTSTTGTGVKGLNSENEEPQFTKKETAAVTRSKVMVYAALFLSSIAVGTLTYIFTSREEKNNFTREVSPVYLSVRFYFV
jgi:hypothetical protein